MTRHALASLFAGLLACNTTSTGTPPPTPAPTPTTPSASASAPKCNQPNAVKCLVDPCQRKAAACQGGKCVVTAGATQ